MQRLLIRLATFLLFAAFNGAFARAEAVKLFNPDIPREQAVFEFVLPSRVEVLLFDILEPSAVLAVPILETEFEFFAAEYVVFLRVIAAKHHARAPPQF
jgi:hypothetical protein